LQRFQPFFSAFASKWQTLLGTPEMAFRSDERDNGLTEYYRMISMQILSDDRYSDPPLSQRRSTGA
jgi:hypothetical protein